MKKIYFITCCLSLVVGSVRAQLVEVDFERAIFLQDTKKEYGQAIKLYKKVVKESNDQSLEAEFRLAECYFELQQTAAYRTVINGLAASRQSKSAWVQKAIVAQKKFPRFSRGVWANQEVTKYEMVFSSGKRLKYMTFLYEQTELHGVASWKQTVLSLGDLSKSVSFIKQGSDEVLESRSINIEGRDSYYPYKKERVWDGKTIGAEQLFSIVRLMSQRIGNTEFLKIKEEGDVNLPVSLKVLGQDRLKVKAGEFECVKIRLSLGLTSEDPNLMYLWVSTGPARELVKIQFQKHPKQAKNDYHIELASISSLDLELERTMKSKIFSAIYKAQGKTLCEAIEGKKGIWRVKVFPDVGIDCGIIEVRHTASLKKTLNTSSEKLAEYFEKIFRKEYHLEEQFILPENKKEVELAGCKGLLYHGEINDEFYVAFYGKNKRRTVSFRGRCEKSEVQAARKELQRILVEDLKFKD